MDPAIAEPREPSSLPYRLLALEAAVLVFQWLRYYPLMPGRMATHFGAGGEANGWMGRDEFLVFFCGMCAFLMAVMLLMPKLIGLFPDSMINMPNKEYWLAPERRAASMALIGAHMAWLAVLVLGLLMAILQLTFLSNLMPEPRLEGSAVALTMGGFLACMLIWLIAFIRGFNLPKTPEVRR
jgi:serine/threonine-protein kinase